MWVRKLKSGEKSEHFDGTYLYEKCVDRRLCRMSVNYVGLATDIRATAPLCRSEDDRHIFLKFWEWSVDVKLTDRQKK